MAKFEDWSVDLILFSHLIPCCQHYVPGEKHDFESTVDELAVSFGDRREFVTFLLGHPKNSYFKNVCDMQGYALIYGYFKMLYYFLLRVLTPRMQQGLPPHRIASWEMTLCLMRNALTHEYDPAWRHVRQMARAAVTFFGGREGLERVIRLFEQRVVFATSI
jgi:hypothetical protein